MPIMVSSSCSCRGCKRLWCSCPAANIRGKAAAGWSLRLLRLQGVSFLLLMLCMHGQVVEGNHETDWPGHDRFQGSATDSGTNGPAHLLQHDEKGPPMHRNPATARRGSSPHASHAGMSRPVHPFPPLISPLQPSFYKPAGHQSSRGQASQLPR